MSGPAIAVAAFATALLLAQTPGVAVAQQSPAQQQPATGNVLVNGALAVPGAPETDTVPAKFSPKSAADDALIIAAYTFKLLTPDQRRAIYQGLKDQPAAPALQVDTPQAEIGTELPFATDLRAVPDAVVARVPQTKGYQYVVANNRVLLVSPQTRFVVGVFSDLK
jgi:hypothetical protein